MEIFDFIVKYVLISIGIIAGFSLLNTIVGLCQEIQLYFTTKRNEILSDSKMKIDALSQKESVPLSVRIENDNSLIALINDIIQNEITILVNSYKVLSKKYNIMALDKDIAVLASNVHSAINLVIYNSDELTLTTDYIHNYIIKNTSSLLTLTVTEYNNSFTAVGN